MSTNEQPPGGGKSLALMIFGVVLTLALVIFWNFRNMRNRQADDARPLPIIAQLDEPLEGINHRGDKVSLAQLKGKVWVLAYFYTECPAGCEGVMGRMKELQDEFKDQADKTHFVAMSMNPDHDTPEVMAAWGKKGQRDMGDGNWWFFSGDTKTIRNYVSKHFKLHVNERTDPKEIAALGALDHEFKFVLVDQNGAIRYYYDVLGEQTADSHAAKIRTDIKTLLNQ